MNKEIIISPSILAADFMNLGKQIEDVKNAGAEWLHFDVMDGIFVPNISVGIPVLDSINKAADIIMDVHLMITEPVRYIDDFRKAGADIITFHIEACNNVKETIDKIKESGAKVGISLKPGTEAKEVFEYLHTVDMALIMTVEPGFGGQKFMKDMMPKVKEIKDYTEKNNIDIHIQVDGGIGEDTIEMAASAGANNFVAGTSVFRASDINKAIKILKSIGMRCQNEN